MRHFISFLPMLLFISIFLGSGLYYTFEGVNNSFYQVSPLIAIIPAVILGWILQKGGNNDEKMKNFLDGARNRDIITMCIIFLFAGAFSEIAKNIGSSESVVNLSFSLIPPRFLIVGLFFISAFISTAIGSSMGTIATVSPISLGFCADGLLPKELVAATIVGGAMFGDNLSLISDTTIASVNSQQANLKKKVKFNGKLALIASIITVSILLIDSHNYNIEFSKSYEYSIILILPYILLISLALLGTNVLVSLILSIILACIIGCIKGSYSLGNISQDILKGFSNVQEIMVLSLMIGGLSGLSSKKSEEFAMHLADKISKYKSQKIAQLMISKVVIIFNLLLANNTIAIICSGKIAKNIAKKHNISNHYSATLLDVFSCVFQGIIPYGAQILLVSATLKISPLSVTPYVYYCYALGLTSLFYILFMGNKKSF